MRRTSLTATIAGVMLLAGTGCGGGGAEQLSKDEHTRGYAVGAGG